MKVLLTGSDGYLGCLAGPYLMQRGHEVVGVDVGLYRAGWLYDASVPTPLTINRDVRELGAADLEGFDAVVHMAELSNDPIGQLRPAVTEEINHHGSVRLARLAKQAAVSRFVHMSSCSVYGLTHGEEVDESSATNPQTVYAVCKTLVERDLTNLADAQFAPTFLRNATAFGASPRMRFDLVLNNLAGLAWTTGEIVMTSDGTPWRPLVHVLDIAKAVACVLEAPAESVRGEVFNVGDDAQNYQVKEMAEIIAEIFPRCSLHFGPASADNRSYRVSFEKISTRLPGFSCEWTAEGGVRQLRDVFDAVDLTPAMFGFRGYTRLSQIEYLLRSGQLDEHLFRRAP